MSKRKNTNGSKPGSIYRIALENFVTFKQVELYPGPNLNMVIGPNGTGKSTFVCAIVLGLCGKPSVIGRAKTIAEYVKSGHNQATIEIELYQQEGESNVIITRNFNLENNSVWSIDNKKVTMKHVQELVERLNIKVDNLCQLLPQDRVQDFAKMNAQELLKSTQIAVSGQEAVDLLDQLIENKKQHRSLTNKLKQTTQLLQEQETTNANMQHIIESMHQRKEMEKKIKICEMKRLWVEYENLKSRLMELNRDREDANKVVASHRENMKPLEKLIDKVKRDVSKYEEAKLGVTRELAELKVKIRKIIDSSSQQNAKIEDIESKLESKIRQQQNRQRDIEQAKATLSKYYNDQNGFMQQYGDENILNKKMADLQQPISKTNSGIENLKQKRVQLQYELDSKIAPQVRLCENKLRQLGDVANKRLEMLQTMSEQTYKAVLWFRNNQELFEGNVYEPMMLEINFKDPNMVKYLENTVPVRDLIAFTFESTSDMNLFMKKVRGEMGLNTVSALCSKPSDMEFQPPMPISELRRFGFQCYLVDCITAPAAIIRYLCKLHGIHRIPIGNKKTYDCSSSVPTQIRFFFSENHRFTIKVSAYSGAKSTSTSEIRPAKFMINSLDQDKLAQAQNELERAKECAHEKKCAMRELDQQLLKLEESLNALRARKKDIHQSIEQIKTVASRIRMQQNKIAALENEANVDIEDEKQRSHLEIKKCVEKQCKLQSEVAELYKTCQNKVLNSLLVGEKLKILRNAILERQRELRELKENAVNAEQLLEHITRQLGEFKSKAREKLMEAKKETGDNLPHENGFPLTKEFSKLPGDVTSLDDLINELHVKITCMGSGDNEIINEYEEREKSIKKLKTNVQATTMECNKLESIMESLKARWLDPLEHQISLIDGKFGEMFAQMGCAGEVKLAKPGGDDAYDEYGINIFVRFRSDEQLQVLNSSTQSGGERALSTALYLMALQQLSKVPFRCVDEINQGMDATNERKMFQLLFNITSSSDVSQYFLLTPKLLPNLDYTSLVKVHTIENGPSIIKYNKWNLNKFLEQARRLQS